jgi:hypothetical protein
MDATNVVARSASWLEMLRHGIGFWSTLAACCMLTLILYLATIWTLGKSETTL